MPEVTITFGKYKGKALDDVAANDPDYVQWMADNMRAAKWRKLAEAALEQVEEYGGEERHWRIRNDMAEVWPY